MEKHHQKARTPDKKLAADGRAVFMSGMPHDQLCL